MFSSQTLLFSYLAGISALLAPSTSAYSTQFTKVKQVDGTVDRFFDLASTESVISGADFDFALSKVHIDPLKMVIDLSDTTFASQVPKKEGESSETRIDLTGTLFAFEDGTKTVTVSSEVTRLKVQVENAALLEKYQFIYDYGPRMWLAEKENGWWPGHLEDYFDNMMATSSNFEVRMTTRIPLKTPFERLDFFHGVKPVDGKGPPCLTMIAPVHAEEEESMDPLEMLLNPELSTVQAIYAYFMPFDQVPLLIASHVGDIEHTSVSFVKGLPTIVEIGTHSSRQYHDFADKKLRKYGLHPVTYNARGTHATYFDEGIQLKHADYTKAGTIWDIWQNLDVVFPWDYTKADRVISTDSNLAGINYLTQVKRWGNNKMGKGIHNQYFLKTGPGGFLMKLKDRKKELEELDYFCQGVDAERCPWPLGIASDHMPLCQPGYRYSYLAKKCFQAHPSSPTCFTIIPQEQDNKMSNLFTSWMAVLSSKRGNSASADACLVKEGSCGKGYETKCDLLDSGASCSAYCLIEPIEAASEDELYAPHMMCTVTGDWVDSTQYPQDDLTKVTFTKDVVFKCPYEQLY